MADFSIYIEETESFADLMVFKQESRLYADRPGMWFVTDNRAFADYVIYLEPTREFADYSVYFTDIESFAGCN